MLEFGVSTTYVFKPLVYLYQGKVNQFIQLEVGNILNCNQKKVTMYREEIKAVSLILNTDHKRII